MWCTRGMLDKVKKVSLVPRDALFIIDHSVLFYDMMRGEKFYSIKIGEDKHRQHEDNDGSQQKTNSNREAAKQAWLTYSRQSGKELFVRDGEDPGIGTMTERRKLLNFNFWLLTFDF